MALVNKSVTNLIGGVSEQTPSVRSDNQVQEQINMFSDVTRGLTKRNGTELVNIADVDIRDRFNITFNVDDQAHMIAVHALDNIDPIKYVPLTANSQVLSATIQDPQYFVGGENNVLQVVEDKDNVYILNRDKEVGVLTSFSAFFDVTVTEDTNGSTSNQWTEGEFTLNIKSDPEVTSTNVSTIDLTIAINKNTQLSTVSQFFNSSLLFDDEVGELTITGNRSNMRLTVDDISSGWAKPIITVTETVPIKYTVYSSYVTGNLNNSGWNIRSKWIAESGPNPYGSKWHVSYQGVTHTFNNVNSIVHNGVTYYRGSAYSSTFDTEGNGTKWYYLKKRVNVTTVHEHSVQVQTAAAPVVYEGSSAKRAIVWCTGVSANQTYNVTIKYRFDAPNNNTIFTNSGSSSVGGTANNIRLNFVAGQLASSLAGTHFTTTPYSNAVLIEAVTGYSILSVEVENNYDITSISGVAEANVKNKEGIINIDNLPPIFLHGFKMRISSKDNDKTNYYMAYDDQFKGWKETSLNRLRKFDNTTMPYIINKEKVRQTGIILVEPAKWQSAEAGDEVSNTDPTFVNRKITSIFFYGSRLGLSTQDTIVLSKINQPDTFYKTTTATISKSDRVDIKLDSSKIGFDPISSVSQYNSGLIINTNTKQSKLLVNNAFELSSARLSEVSSYSLGNSFPISSDNSLYFHTSNNDRSSVISFKQLSETQYVADDLTQHCPNYIRGNITQMVYSNNLTCVRTDTDKRTVYIQNSLNKGIEVVQNAWHKWILPYDIEFTYFNDNYLYFVMSYIDTDGLDKTIISKFNFKPNEIIDDKVNILMDCYSSDLTILEKVDKTIGVDISTGKEFNNYTEAFEATQITNNVLVSSATSQDLSIASGYDNYIEVIDTNTTHLYYRNSLYVFGNSDILFNQIVENSIDLYINRDEEPRVVGGVIYDYTYGILGSETSELGSVLFGLKFKSSVTLSEIAPKQQTKDGVTILSYAKLMLRRMRLVLEKSGKFEVLVNLLERKDFKSKFTGKPLGNITLGRSDIDDINFNFPINAKADKVSIEIVSDNTTPLNIISTEWQGQLITKGRNI